METEDTKKNWWSTLPGILTSIAGVITATTAFVAAISNTGLFTRPSVVPQVTPGAPSSDAAVPAAPVPIRFWIRALPEVPGADAAKLFDNALGSWQAVLPTTISRTDSEARANVIVDTAPDQIAVADIGPPLSTSSTPLKIIFGSQQKWTAQTFEAASCRMLGHILGLGYTQVPGQLMTKGVDLDSLPMTPQSDDVKKVRAKWEK